jgi:Tfp pilus assembly protein PilN
VKVDDLIKTVIEQFPTLAGILLLALVLYRQNEKAQATNDRLTNQIIELAIEMRDCLKAASQQKETD